MGANAFEDIIYQGAVYTVGDPMFIGLLVFIFFAGFVMLQNIPTSAKVLVLAGASILALAFMPTWIIVLVGLVMAGLLYLGVMRWMSK